MTKNQIRMTWEFSITNNEKNIEIQNSEHRGRSFFILISEFYILCSFF